MSNTTVQRKSKAYKIYAELLRRLDLNLYSRHAPMPGISVLAGEFGVTAGTADRALRMLAADGRVVRKVGSGTYPVRFIKQPRIACLLPDKPVSNPVDHWSHSWICTQSIIERLQRANCNFKVFSYCDLLQSYFSPRLLNDFDVLIAERSFCDDNSRKMLYEFKGTGILVGGTFPICAPVCQLVPDFLSALTEILKKARRAGVKKLVFHFHNPEFQKEFLTAAMLADWERADCLFMPQMNCNLLDAYRRGQCLEASRELFHVCSADTMAAGIYQALIDRGLHPGEFAVSGCGNNEEYGFLPLNGKHLTSMDRDYGTYASTLIDLMFARLKSGDTAPNIIKVPMFPVFRDSTFF